MTRLASMVGLFWCVPCFCGNRRFAGSAVYRESVYTDTWEHCILQLPIRLRPQIVSNRASDLLLLFRTVLYHHHSVSNYGSRTYRYLPPCGNFPTFSSYRSTTGDHYHRTSRERYLYHACTTLKPHLVKPFSSLIWHIWVLRVERSLGIQVCPLLSFPPRAIIELVKKPWLTIISCSDDDDWCTGSHIGYDPLAEMARTQTTNYDRAQGATVRTLTHVMVLHPIAVALSFIAFLLAIGSGFIGAIFAASVSLLAFLVSVVVLATDITLFSVVRNKVNDMNDGRNVQWGTGFWTLVAGMVVLFLATVIVLATCCSSRLHARRQRRVVADDKYATHTRTTRRRFWQRRSRY